MKKMSLLMLVFALFASTSVYAQKLKNGTYKESARTHGYGDVYVNVSVSGREIKEIFVYTDEQVQDIWMNSLITGNNPLNPDMVSSSEIKDFEVNSSLVKKEGPHYNSVQEFANAIVTNQSTVIDVMSGATRTCEGIIEAVHNALRSKNGDIVRAWEQEGTQKRLATAQRRNTLKEEERQKIAKAEEAETERKRLEEEERRRLAAEKLEQELQNPVTPAANEFKYDVASDGGVKIIRYLGNAMSIKIPEKIEGLTVTEIENGAFGKNTLVKIVIPSSIKSYSFYHFKELREVIFEDDRTDIHREAFKDCENLKSIKLPTGLQMIGYGAFENSGLASFDIPDSVTSIDGAAFNGCKNLKSVKLPAGLKVLESNIFEDSGLESIIIPDSVVKIGEYAFNKCTNLKSVTLPKKNSIIIEAYAFRGCRALSEIIIPDTLKRISFGYNYNLIFSGCNFSLATKSKLRELGYSGEF